MKKKLAILVLLSMCTIILPSVFASNINFKAFVDNEKTRSAIPRFYEYLPNDIKKTTVNTISYKDYPDHIKKLARINRIKRKEANTSKDDYEKALKNKGITNEVDYKDYPDHIKKLARIHRLKRKKANEAKAIYEKKRAEFLEARSAPNAVKLSHIDRLPLKHKNNNIKSLKYRIENYRKKNAFAKPVSLEELNELVSDKRITFSEKEALIDFGYTCSDPILYRPSEKPVSNEDFTINLLWIHKNTIDGGHLFGDNNQKLEEHVIAPIISWITKQPNAIINFWYDSERHTSSDSAIKNTLNILKNRNINIDLFSFKDLRSIPRVVNNDDLYGEEIPIYFRVDFSKMLIADYLMVEKKQKFVVNVDGDISAINQGHLFNSRSIFKLERSGFSMANINGTGNENSFIMLQSHDFVIERHNEMIEVDLLKRVHDKVKKGEEIDPQDAFQYKGFKEFCRKRAESNYSSDVLNKGLYGNSYPGHSLIGPKSRFGIFGGYSEEEQRYFESFLAD